jgi:hypothetical protein
VYLFAPLRHLLKEADLQNFRLENGLKIWPALWDYRHPNALCFTAPVRPKKSSSSNKIRVNGSSTPATTVTTATAAASRFSIAAPLPTQPTSAASSSTASTVVPVPPPPPPPRDVVFNDVFIGTFANCLQRVEQSQSFHLVSASLVICFFFFFFPLLFS